MKGLIQRFMGDERSLGRHTCGSVAVTGRCKQHAHLRVFSARAQFDARSDSRRAFLQHCCDEILVSTTPFVTFSTLLL